MTVSVISSRYAFCYFNPPSFCIVTYYDACVISQMDTVVISEVVDKALKSLFCHMVVFVISLCLISDIDSTSLLF